MSLITMKRKSNSIRKTASIPGFTNGAAVAPSSSYSINNRINIKANINAFTEVAITTSSSLIQAKKATTFSNESLLCPNSNNGSTGCNKICNVVNSKDIPSSSSRIERIKKGCIDI